MRISTPVLIIFRERKRPIGVQSRRPHLLIFSTCGLWLARLGLYFAFQRPPLLPEDLRYMDIHPDQIQEAVPSINRWLTRVFTVMGGFMFGAGVLTFWVARQGSPHEQWTWVVLALTGASTVGTMSVTNFQLKSDFRWVLLIPVLLWSAGLVLSFPT